jgi:selenide,water dikinase
MQVLHHLPPVTDPDVLVGAASADDAAVYRLDDGRALVQSLDFFTPIVDDPYDFGRIAAANSLSDIYAMGARPLLALNIVAFPRSELPMELLFEILRGGADKASEAGIPIVGGHSIDDNEPKYGLVVTGLIDPAAVVKNSPLHPGDLLILTKPIGSGIIATAIKGDKAPPEVVERMVQVASTLNKSASEAMVAEGVSAATDVTGFGLLGHLFEMTQASGVAVEVRASAVPVIEGTWPLAEVGTIPGGTRRNLAFVEDNTVWTDGTDDMTKLVLCDAQTSGGLLIGVAEERAAGLLERLAAAEGVLAADVIGRVTQPDPAGTMTVLP